MFRVATEHKILGGFGLTLVSLIALIPLVDDSVYKIVLVSLAAVLAWLTWRILLDVRLQRRSIDELAFSEHRLTAVLENIAASVYLKDTHGHFIWVNQLWSQRWKYDEKDIQGKTAYDLFPKPIADSVWESDQQVLRTGKVLDYEINADVHGEAQTYHVLKFPLFDAEQKITAVGSISYDITVRKQAEEALQRSESRLAQILKVLPVGVWNVDAQGNMIDANPEAKRIWGEVRKVGPEQYHEYRAWWLDGRRVELHQSPLGRAVNHGESSLNQELEIATFDGQRRFILNSAVPLRDAQGMVVGAVAVNQDITASKEAQQVLVRAARFEQTQREVLSLFSASYDRSSILQKVLGLLARHHEIPASAFYNYDEWAGTLQCEASWGAPAQLLPSIRLGEGLVGQAALSNRWQLLDNMDQRDSGFDINASFLSFRPASVIAYPINLQERRLGVIVLATGRSLREDERRFIESLGEHLAVALQGLRQYSDIKLMAEQLRQHGEEIARKNVQLEEASRMKSEFLANMSHELRTPLNAVIGFSEALKDGLLGDLPDGQKLAVADIFDSGQHLLSLINDILDLSKVEAGKMALELESVDVAGLIANSVTIIKEKAHNHGLRLNVEIEPLVARALLDGRKLKQILYNLLSNAVKFTPSGGQVALAVRTSSTPPPEIKFAQAALSYIEFAVTDTGIGIPAAHLSQLFEPFSQVESSLSRRFQGTGLGLTMVKKLAELHGGGVCVKSELGVGSRFAVWLPYRSVGSESGASKAAATARPKGAREELLVLVVEDEDQAASVLQLQLEGEGMRVVRAIDADSALDMALQQRPDLITLDVLLPGKDGWTFLEQLKMHPLLADIPVVMISILADADRGLALGAAQVLQKPVSQPELMSALSACGLTVEHSGEVLVVDDDPRAVDLIAILLESAGHRVHRAYGGAEAIQIARQRQPDLIVLDLMMPEVSGFDVVEALRINEKDARTPILIMTAKRVSAEERDALDGRIVKIVEKAELDRRSFLNEVRRALAARYRPSIN